MTSLKGLIGGALRRFGYQAVPTDLLTDLGLCTHLRRLFQTQHVDAVFDVGANRGQFRHLLRKGVEFKGTILSFEPIPELSAFLLQQSRHDSNWHVYPFALGESEAILPFKIMRSPVLSSFLSPDTTHTDRFRDANTPVREEFVSVKCLDDIFAGLAQEFGIERPYLKLDTQGYDMVVVNGARQTLGNFVALQTEASVLPAYKGMLDYRETIRQLNERGFALSGVFPVSRDERFRLIEFDCVMVNPDKIEFVPVEVH